jgi:heparan-alpha-glucosaminide N-acetyltransferase
MKPPSKRLQPIDLFRAITMLLMIFVNDVAGVKNIPEWIEHTKATEDGMGFADTIFPAFLFIVGLSLPFAINSRIQKKHSYVSIALHILLRSLALIVMGFFHVNMESYSSAALLPKPVWTILITAAFFLIWLDYSPTMGKAKKYSLIVTGILLLVIMAYLFKGGSANAPAGMKPEWWGILGIIGWAYLVSACIYLLVKGNFYALLVALALLLFINISVHTNIVQSHIWVIGDASAASLIMMGVVIGILYGRLSAARNYSGLWWLFASLGLIMIAAGFMVRPYTGGISKIMATPAWVLICAGISTLVFEGIIWLTDIKGKQNWFRIIRPAGTSTLTCYLIPYILYAVFALLHLSYPSFLKEGIGGIVRSLVVAFVVVLLGGMMERVRLRLKI